MLCRLSRESHDHQNHGAYRKLITILGIAKKQIVSTDATDHCACQPLPNPSHVVTYPAFHNFDNLLYLCFTESPSILRTHFCAKTEHSWLLMSLQAKNGYNERVYLEIFDDEYNFLIPELNYEGRSLFMSGGGGKGEGIKFQQGCHQSAQFEFPDFP